MKLILVCIYLLSCCPLFVLVNCIDEKYSFVYNRQSDIINPTLGHSYSPLFEIETNIMTTRNRILLYHRNENHKSNLNEMMFIDNSKYFNTYYSLLYSYIDSLDLCFSNDLQNDSLRYGVTIGYITSDSTTLVELLNQDSVFYWMNYSKDLLEVISYELIVCRPPYKKRYYKYNGAVISRELKEKLRKKKGITMIGIVVDKIKFRHISDSVYQVGTPRRYNIISPNNKK